jgi:hypothetical protein
MSLEGWIKTLELLIPIAKAVPVLGSPVEGSLEAAVKILRFAQVRRLRRLHENLDLRSHSGREDEQEADKRARRAGRAMDTDTRERIRQGQDRYL